MSIVAVPLVEVPLDPSCPDIEVMPDGAGEWRVIGPDEAVPAGEIVEALVERARRAVAALREIDPALLDADAANTLALGVEEVGRRVTGAAVRVAAHVDEHQCFRPEGFFSTQAWLKHRLQLSGPEAFGRMQMVRAGRTLPAWAGVHAAGLVGTAQFRLMARIAANPRIHPDVLRRDAWELLDDAIDCSYREFERRALTWEALADPAGSLAKSERARTIRNVTLAPRHDGGWTLTGTLDDIGGAEFNEILSHFIDAEWRADWRDACETVGDGATVADLRRTEAQRRADALCALARAAAANVGSTGAAVPTVDFIIDEATAAATVLGEPIDPARYREIVSRTAAGQRVHPRDLVNTALWAHVRRVVRDSAGVVIDLGRRARLFTGSARDAVMLLQDHCVWLGCEQPTAWCQADHAIGWKGWGPTAPNNGQPLCRGHNRLKEHGYRVFRDADGRWHTIAPDGSEIT